MKKIIVKNSHLELPEYMIGDCPKLEKSLCYWDKEYHKYIPVGYEYDIENEILYVPRGLDINFVAKITDRQLSFYKDENNKPGKANIKLTSGPRDENQVKGINYLVGGPGFENTKDFTQKVLILPTGKGKTYISIASMSIIREKTVIITHLERITDQWVDSLKKFTKLDEEDIKVLEGSSGINKILKQYDKYGDLPYKLYFISHGTIQSYGKRNGWDKVDELFRKLKIGTKIFDEAHLNFSRILQLDFHTNVKRTFYLTATFQRSDIHLQVIFDLAFKNVIKYGNKLQYGRKHINYVISFFNTKPTQAEKFSFHGKRGFLVKPYCNYLVSKEEFYTSLWVLLNQFTTFEGTILILIGTIDGCNTTASRIANKYPDEKVTVLHSGIKGKENRENAMRGSIIVSTIESFGTGVDLAGLRFCINTVPYSSQVTADQLSGRLREYDSTSYSIYVDMIDKGFTEIDSMRKRRMSVLKNKCNSISILE